MIDIGSVIGDMCGSVYEFNNLADPNDLKLFEVGATYTDDTVMSCAIMRWLLDEKEHDRESLCQIMKKYGTIYPNVGYGGMFWNWICSDDLPDYGSYGNGSGMRVSPVAYYAKTLDECLDLAEITAKTTHGHEEGIKGAQAIACAIFLARKGFTKDKIKKEITERFGYDLERNWVNIGWQVHGFDCTCQITVPEAIICFLQSTDFEDCIKKSILIGGDTDTVACMAGGIAEAFYGVPAYLQEKAKALLDDRLTKDMVEFSSYCNNDCIMGRVKVPERKTKQQLTKDFKL